MNVCLVGLGKIGLPLAIRISEAGHDVVGLDVDPTRVDEVNRGIEPFPGESELDVRLRAAVERRRLRATTDPGVAVPEADVVVIVVPLAVDEAAEPDFSNLDAASSAVGSALRDDTLVVYETTMPVGTTRDRCAPLLEAASGKVAGRSFHVAYSPERVFSGRIFADLERYPKIVGGIDDESARRAEEFYRSVLNPGGNGAGPAVWNLGACEGAELCKLAETTYRDINIAFANEIAQLCDRLGIDADQVITAANSQPYSHIHRPGIAVGGHCIPVYPHLFLASSPDAALPATSRAVNSAMPEYAVEQLEDWTGGLAGSKVAVLGAAYRGGVKELAFSGVRPLVAALLERGATVTVHDPLFTDDELRAEGFVPHELGTPVDAAVVQADHIEYRDLGPEDLPGVRAVYDGRRCLDPDRWRGHRLGGVGWSAPTTEAPTNVGVGTMS